MAECFRLVLAERLCLTYPTLGFKEVLVSLKMRVLPFGTLCQTLVGLENFCKCCQLSLTIDFASLLHLSTGIHLCVQHDGCHTVMSEAAESCLYLSYRLLKS